MTSLILKKGELCAWQKTMKMGKKFYLFLLFYTHIDSRAQKKLEMEFVKMHFYVFRNLICVWALKRKVYRWNEGGLKLEEKDVSLKHF